MRSLVGFPRIVALTAAAGILTSSCASRRESAPISETPTGAEEEPPNVDAGIVDETADSGPAVRLEPLTVECKVTPCVTALAARGGAHVCALLSDKTVRCWGANESGQLGHAPSAEKFSGVPLEVAGLNGATEISVSGRNAQGTSCACLEDGAIMCWGANTHGELGLMISPATIDGDVHPAPSRVQGLPPAARVDVGGTFACAVSRSDGESLGGQMYCWGWNHVLQLGRGYTPQRHAGAAQVKLGPRVVVSGAGTARNAFAISDRGELLSWGGAAWDNDMTPYYVNGEYVYKYRDALGRESSFQADAEPTAIATLAGVVSVSAGDEHACAVSRGVAYCWGRNQTGGLGSGSLRDLAAPYPVAVQNIGEVAQVSASNRTTCARTVSGLVYCWGDNSSGQLGGGSSEANLLPVRANVEGVVQVAAMDDATCVLLQDGSVQCWGSNARGQLGLGANDALAHYSPELVRF